MVRRLIGRLYGSILRATRALTLTSGHKHTLCVTSKGLCKENKWECGKNRFKGKQGGRVEVSAAPPRPLAHQPAPQHPTKPPEPPPILIPLLPQVKKLDKQLKDNWGLETLVAVGESWLPAMLEQDAVSGRFILCERGVGRCGVRCGCLGTGGSGGIVAA